MPRTFTPTRAAGLASLAATTQRLGRAYAAQRNTDRGPDAPTTSELSPYLRRRLVSEDETIAAARAAHGGAAEKFVEEVFWRNYFKGHLETRPALWADYRRRVEEGRAELERNAGLRRGYAEAIEGRTGIDGFDHWARELVAANWLHNHVRMWFASIWIFTLGLPWALGADFFMQHLLDGDPASNTLSWRWVAGLHTRGRTYAARAENIRRHTEGRHDPRGLNEAPSPLAEPEPPAPVPLPEPGPAPSGDVALLLHVDDLHPETLNLGRARVVRVGGLLAHADGAAPPVRAFDEGALADGLARASAVFDCPVAASGPDWAEGLPIVTAWAPVGPSADALPPANRIRRAWDSNAWPRSTKGYFQVKAAIPRLLAAAAID